MEGKGKKREGEGREGEGGSGWEEGDAPTTTPGSALGALNADNDKF